jgi:hypothetical protein
MNFNKQLDRSKKMHQLIEAESTGYPEQFSQLLHLSCRQLYNELGKLKELVTILKHSKKKCGLNYTQHFGLARISP